jgi:hypothetical protein
MADSRTVFTILEDNSTGAGVKLPARAAGDASGGNHAPVITAKDSSGNYQLIEQRLQGQSASTVGALPVLGAKDLNGDLQLINARDEGAAVSGVDALPGLVAKDGSGNFKYLLINNEGELVVSNEPNGSNLDETAIVTPASINTLTTVVNVTLAVDEVYESIEVRGSCSFPVKWELVQVNDVTLTVLDSFLTGPGQYTFTMKYDSMVITAGASGTQQLRLRGTQLQGSVSDMHGYVGAFQKA